MIWMDAGCWMRWIYGRRGGWRSYELKSNQNFIIIILIFFLLLLLLCLSPLLCVDWCRCLTGITAADSESISSVTTGDSTHLPSNWFRWIETLNCKILGGQSVETCWALATNQTPIPISGYDRLKFSFWFAGHTRWRSITRRANRSEAVTCECDIMIAGGVAGGGVLEVMGHVRQVISISSAKVAKDGVGCDQHPIVDLDLRQWSSDANNCRCKRASVASTLTGQIY